MKIDKIIIKGFKCFKEKTEITLESLTCFIGTNSSGKSATLEALCRLFGDTNYLKTIQKTDFYVEPGKKIEDYENRSFYIEVIVSFPELDIGGENTNSIPSCFSRMYIPKSGERPHCRIRLEAEWERGVTSDGNLNYATYWVLSDKEDLKVDDKIPFKSGDKNKILVHYIPAIRNPEKQLKNVTGTIVKRLFDSIAWNDEIQKILEKSASDIKDKFCKEDGVKVIQDTLNSFWSKYIYEGKYNHISLTPIETDLSSIIRQINVYFSPGQSSVNDSVEKLSDGTRSLFYLTLFNALFDVENKIFNDNLKGFDKTKINKPCLTIFALEEPENHLAPHYIGRIISVFRDLIKSRDAQTILTTHSASIVKRIEPEEIRYFRLLGNDFTMVKKISLPNDDETEKYKYVKEAIKSYPEIYFSRLVIFGEGDSEEFVIPRLAKWDGIDIDTSFVSFVPLAGRFVNHFWKLANDLEIPYLTLLDLDDGRSTGGEERIGYITKELEQYSKLKEGEFNKLSDLRTSKEEKLNILKDNGIFFSSPIDIDFVMLKEFKKEYIKLSNGQKGPNIPSSDVDKDKKDKETIASVLKTSADKIDMNNIPDKDIELYYWYRYLFLGRGKPVSHLNGILNIEENKKENIPSVYKPLMKMIKEILKL